MKISQIRTLQESWGKTLCKLAQMIHNVGSLPEKSGVTLKQIVEKTNSIQNDINQSEVILMDLAGVKFSPRPYDFTKKEGRKHFGGMPQANLDKVCFEGVKSMNFMMSELQGLKAKNAYIKDDLTLIHKDEKFVKNLSIIDAKMADMKDVYNKIINGVSEENLEIENKKIEEQTKHAEEEAAAKEEVPANIPVTVEPVEEEKEEVVEEKKEEMVVEETTTTAETTTEATEELPENPEPNEPDNFEAANAGPGTN